MPTSEAATGRAAWTAWNVVTAYCATDAKILWRMRTPLVLLFVMPTMLSVTLGPAATGQPAGGSARSLLGFAVMFSLMTTNYVGMALFREFAGGTWLRQAVHRPSRAARLLGKALPVAGLGLLQLAVFAAVAFTVLDMPSHGHPAQLLVVGVALVAFGAVVGVLLYTLTSATSVFQSASLVLVIGTGLVGGAVVLPEHLPPVSRALGPVTPHYWALRALEASTTGSGSWGPALQAVAVIGGVTLPLAAIALATFDYGREKSVLT